MARIQIEFGEPRRDCFRNRVSGVLIQSEETEEKNRGALQTQNTEALRVEMYL